MAMTYEDLLKIVIAARPILSDELALNTYDMFPKWEDNIGLNVTQEMLDRGQDRYQHGGKLYKVLQPTLFQSQFEPGAEGMAALFLEVTLEEWPEWRQPTGAHDAYNTGDKVTYNGERYISKIDGNTTVPGSDERYWEKVL